MTKELYLAMNKSLDAHGDKIVELQARVGQLEVGIKAISMQMGFAGKIPGEFNLER